MAAWQVDLFVLPRRAIATASQPITQAALEQTDWWDGVPFPADYAVRLAAVASATPASLGSAGHERWGSEEGNRVDVWSARAKVMRVTVSVDVRRLDSKFGAALITFVRSAGAVLVRRDGLIVEPMIGAYAGALRGSSAWRYASDPAAFLASYAEGDADEDQD